MDIASSTFKSTVDYALKMDATDPLSSFRDEFLIPEKNGRPVLYFTGNSLGLQPRRLRAYMNDLLDKWATEGVEGHFSGESSWYNYHRQGKEMLATLTGAMESEVVAMNNLTSNLHLMLVSFYRPTSKRFKILMEASAFPSDQYVIESQVRFHGFDPDTAIIEVEPKNGAFTLEEDDIIQAIEDNADELALVFFSGVQYFTGQKFPIKRITRAAHSAGALAGFDLAHAIGNVSLNLHEDDVDFAAWCTYKYLNSGPGGASGIFVHERYGEDSSLPRFAGWWGYDKSSRFMMRKGFKPMEGADGWQLSNINILGTVGHIAALSVFEEAGWQALLEKSRKLTAYLRYLLEDLLERHQAFTIITPQNPEQRGCQLSLFFPRNGRRIFEFLEQNGVIGDWREDQLTGSAERSGVIRIAPVPLYNNFRDVQEFSVLLEQALNETNG